uniref:Uncharacterized protein n=1 Tax=Romanomermis culicivorax TaxID=13658 RepID=A0A915HN21_ROMCU
MSDPVTTYCYMNNSVSDLFNIRLEDFVTFANIEQIKRYCTEIGKFLECAKSMPQTNIKQTFTDYFSSIRECQLLKDKQEDSEEFKCLLQVRDYISQYCTTKCSKPSLENLSQFDYVVKNCERLRCIKSDCLKAMQHTRGSSECAAIGRRVMDEDYEKYGKFIALTVLKAIGKYNADATSCDTLSKQ